METVQLKPKTKSEIQRCLAFHGGRSRPDKSAPFILMAMRPLANSEKPVRVLDVGCGRGSFGYIVRAEFGDSFQMCGVEANRRYLDDQMTRVYERIWVENYLGTYIIRNDFDVFLFVDVLEHFQEGEAITIVEFIRRNAKDATIIASIPNAPKHWHQNPVYEQANPFEKHRHNWTNDQVEKDLGLKLIGDCDGIGVYVHEPKK